MIFIIVKLPLLSNFTMTFKIQRNSIFPKTSLSFDFRWGHITRRSSQPKHTSTTKINNSIPQQTKKKRIRSAIFVQISAVPMPSCRGGSNEAAVRSSISQAGGSNCCLALVCARDGCFLPMLIDGWSSNKVNSSSGERSRRRRRRISSNEASNIWIPMAGTWPRCASVITAVHRAVVQANRPHRLIGTRRPLSSNSSSSRHRTSTNRVPRTPITRESDIFAANGNA